MDRRSHRLRLVLDNTNEPEDQLRIHKLNVKQKTEDTLADTLPEVLPVRRTVIIQA